MNNLTGRPFSQEAEEAVIGAVLLNPEAFVPLVAFLRADDFFLLRHKYIWEAFTRLNERGEPFDFVVVAEELDNAKQLVDVGGHAYLVHLANNTPSAFNAEFYARIVQRTAVRRRLIEASDAIRTLANDETRALDDVISEVEAKLFSVTDAQIKRSFVPMWEAMSNYYDHMERLLMLNGRPVGVPTGFRELDQLLGGFQRSDLLVFAGRPGMGKTSFLLTIALNTARLGARVGIFTMEMGVEQIVQRIVAMESGINVQKLRLGQLTPAEVSRFTEVVGRLSELRIFIDDTPALSPLDIRTKSRRLQHEHGLDLVIVDYMQLMNAGKGYENNRVQEISYISRSLKELARELNVPLISAAQLSRAVEQRQDKRPVLSDLRESGCVTGDALVYLPDEGRTVPIRDLIGKTDFAVLSLNLDTYQLERGCVTHSFCTGVQPVFKLTTALGRTIRATANHKFVTVSGWKRLDALAVGEAIALPRYDDTQVARGVAPTPYKGLAPFEPAPIPTLQALARSDVYWDAIVSIEADGVEEVFDLTVEPHHSYVCNDIVISNSIEQDADIVMFLYRDEVYNEATEYPNQADVIVAKHRNGPTGTISLYFEKSLTKFMDANRHRVDLSDLE
jgi:replicative DNA helicase